jgi:hypothetical protein
MRAATIFGQRFVLQIRGYLLIHNPRRPDEGKTSKAKARIYTLEKARLEAVPFPNPFL